MSQQQIHKMKFLSLCNHHHVDVLMLYRKTGIHPTIIGGMFWGYGMQRATAQQVLDALNEFAGTTYALDDLDVVLTPESANMSHYDQ